MKRQPLALRPHDVCVALQLALTPDLPFRDLAKSVSVSLGEAHNATQRLRSARLVLPNKMGVNRPALLEFLLHGVPYAFPGNLGPIARGVPTAHSGPVLGEYFPPVDPIVWPHHGGKARGAALTPLCRDAPEMVSRNPDLYRILTLVDALRVGRAREKRLGQELLQSALNTRAA